MNDKKLLKEFVVRTLLEGWFLRDEEKGRSREKETGFLSGIKKLFTGKSEEVEVIADDWLDEQSLYLDMDFDEDFMKEVRDFVASRYEQALRRAKGNERQAESLMRKVLDTRYGRRLRDEARGLKRMRDDEDLD